MGKNVVITYYVAHTIYSYLLENKDGLNILLENGLISIGFVQKGLRIISFVSNGRY